MNMNNIRSPGELVRERSEGSGGSVSASSEIDPNVEIALRDPNDGAIAELGNGGNNSASNLTFDSQPSHGQIRHNDTAITLTTDGFVIITCQGDEVLKISKDSIVVAGDLEISVNTLRTFMDVINNKIGSNELLNIVKEKMKPESNEELIDKRLGAIEGGN